MTETYFIHDLEDGEKSTFTVQHDEDWLDRLEETLYVLYELTPCYRQWKSDICRYDGTMFRYGLYEEYLVLYDDNSNTFTIKPAREV